MYLDLLNHVTFSEGVKFVFGFTDKFFCVDYDKFNHVLMEGLGYKLVRIHLVSAKDVWM